MSRVGARPRTAQSCTIKTRPRYEQIAAASVIPVQSFRGFPDLQNKDQFRLPHSSPTAKETKTQSREFISARDLLTDPECQAAAKDIDNLPEDDIPFLRKLAEYLRLRARVSAMSQNFERALMYREKREIVLKKCKTKPKVDRDEKELIDCEEKLENLDKYWSQRIEEYKAETRGQAYEITAKHNEILAELPHQWETVVSQEYRKPSPELIRKRSIQADLIRRDHIENACLMQEEIIDLEKKERDEAEFRFRKGYDEARRSMTVSQSRELESFLSRRCSQTDQFIAQWRKEDDLLRNRINVLKNKPKQQTRFADYYSSGPLQARPTAVLSSQTPNIRKKLPMVSLSQKQWSKSAKKRFTNVDDDEDEELRRFFGVGPGEDLREEKRIETPKRPKKTKPQMESTSLQTEETALGPKPAEKIDMATGPDTNRDKHKHKHREKKKKLVDMATDVIQELPGMATPHVEVMTGPDLPERSNLKEVGIVTGAKLAQTETQTEEAKEPKKEEKKKEPKKEEKKKEPKKEKKAAQPLKVGTTPISLSNHKYYQRDSDGDADTPRQSYVVKSNEKKKEVAQSHPKPEVTRVPAKTRPVIPRLTINSP